MELLDRYLHAIKFWLPRAQQEDIAAELSEDIRSQIEDEESKLGRKLNDFDVASILKQRGRPLVVANRYLPQQYLIGPVLFPVYRFVLIIVALCYLVPWLLVWIGLVLLDPSYRTGHALLTDLARGWPSFWLVTFIAVGAVTTVFAVLERVQSRNKFLDDWDPLKLPAVRDPNRIPRVSSVIELAVNLAFIVWWVTGAWSQVIFEASGVRIVLTPAWRGFFWAFLLIAVGNVGLASLNLVRRHWTQLSAFLRLALDSAGAIAFCWLFKASLLAEIVAPKLSSAEAAQLVDTINTTMVKCFPFAVLAGALVVALSSIGRLIRLRTASARLIHGVAVIAVLAAIAARS